MRAPTTERMISIMAGAALAAVMLFSWPGKADAGAASDQSRKDDEMEVKKGYAPVDGLRIYYEIHGTASPTHPPLVLLHARLAVLLGTDHMTLTYHSEWLVPTVDDFLDDPMPENQ